MKAAVISAVMLLSLCGGPRAAAQDEGAQARGRERHGWLGVAIQDVTPRVAREKNLPVKSGALVNDVTDESPAGEAGIREGDVIVAFNGKAVEESDDLLSAVRGAAPGDKANVTVYRGQEKKEFQVTLDRAPGRGFAFRGPMHFRIPPIPRIPHMRIFRTDAILGLTLMELNDQLGEYFGAPHGRGVLVEEVEHESTGEKAGFKAGDVIIGVGKESVKSPGDVEDALGDLKKGEKTEVRILRKGAEQGLTVESPGREKWHGSESFRWFQDGENGPGVIMEHNTLKRELEQLREELRSMGSQIRSRMRHLGEELRSVLS